MTMNERKRYRLLRGFRGLWLSRDFRRLWTSLTITAFGAQVTNLALPLTAALLLNATPMQMGILVALETLPFALYSLHAGVPYLSVKVINPPARSGRKARHDSSTSHSTTVSGVASLDVLRLAGRVNE